jgi:hypothetical protein
MYLFVKYSQNSNLNNLLQEEAQINRRFTHSEKFHENKSNLKLQSKPSIDSLPYIRRSSFNSSNNINSNIENENGFIINSNNTINSTNMNSSIGSKKEEIKKWLSRI